MKPRLKLLAAASLIMGVAGASYAASYTSTVSPTTGAGIVQFSELDLTPITCFDDAGKTKVRANLTTLGDPIVLKGVHYESGVGTHAPSVAVIELNGATSFHVIFGIDDDAKTQADHGIADYKVTLYKDKVATDVATGTVTRTSTTAEPTDIDVAGYDYMRLEYDPGAQAWADQCVWADARFNYSGTAPAVIEESMMYFSTEDPTKVSLPESGPNGEEIVPISSMDITKITNGWGTVKKCKTIDSNALTLKGITYFDGVGIHASAKVNVKLNGAVTAFHAVIGIDDEVKKSVGTSTTQGVCDYSVTLVKQNGTENVVKSGTISHLDAEAVKIDITENLGDYKYLIIEFPEGTGGNGNDHVDLANAYFEYVEQNSTRPELVAESEMGGSLACATVMFSQPGVKFMHKLIASDPTAAITVSNLPEGLTFNAKRNLVEGIVETEGEYTYVVTVTSGVESTDQTISLTVSSNLDQPVPFMGWLSWNVVQGDISENVIRTVSDAFVSQGLLDAGYNYLVIDDLWHATSRAADGSPRPDAAKFPNGIEAAADYAHSKGLKFGIYSDGGTATCAGKFGSYGYETIDANTYAKWGVDLLKYDYCNAPADLKTCKQRYQAMGDALKASGRSILFYMCEWGVREPWKWAPETGASCWRSTYDTRDGWNGKNGGIGMVESVAGMKDLWPYSGVNRWNDADMMCVGIHGTGKSSSDLVSGTPGMTQTEYRSQFAMWCMWSSPLTLSFDLRKAITADDLALMTNPELIALDQDRMGQAAEFILEDANGCQLYAKDLENGDVAVAVINMSSSAKPFTIDFTKISALDPEQTYTVRNLQDRKDEADVTGSMDLGTIASHETKVYRLATKEINSIVSPAETLGAMTVKTDDGEITVCIPASQGATKRILLSDTEGRIVASATTADECVSFGAPAKGVYVVNAICAGRSQSVKIVI